ncbi:MAG: response regulator transcription factor [Flavobacteriales bacterium]
MKFLLADDHLLLRQGLIRIIKERWQDAQGFEASNDTEVFQLIDKHDYAFIILDISMPGRGGLEILKQIKSQGIAAPVLVLSMHPEEQYAIRVLKAGASGYLHKDSAPEELINALEKILSGRKYVTATVAERLAELAELNHTNEGHELLSDRELEVLQLIASGSTVGEVAEQLSLSVNTISTYRSRILEKLRLQNNSEMTRYAIDNGLA